MRNLITHSLGLILIILCGCNSNNNQINKLKGQPSNQSKLSEKHTNQDTQHNGKSEKELRYLYYSNGGMIGYFSDGTIAGCPKCDFCRTNIVAMFKAKPIGRYIVKHNGCLLVNKSEKRYPKGDKNTIDHWALIDYKWNERVPQY